MRHRLTGKFPLHELECRDFLSELFSLMCIIQSKVEPSLHDTDVSLDALQCSLPPLEVITPEMKAELMGGRDDEPGQLTLTVRR